MYVHKKVINKLRIGANNETFLVNFRNNVEKIQTAGHITHHNF